MCYSTKIVLIKSVGEICIAPNRSDQIKATDTAETTTIHIEPTEK